MKHLFSLILLISAYTLSAQQVSYICGPVNKVLTIVCTGCTGGTTYSWTSPSNVTTTGQTVTATMPGTWTWSITSNGCAAVTGTHVINQELQPTVTINAVDACLNANQTITATGVPAGYTYSWNFGANATPATSTTASTSVAYSAVGSKTITLTISKVMPGGQCTATCTWTYTKTINISNITGTSTCS